ncbi:MAG: glycosyltransferase family 39 protein [bacterium]
METAPHKQPAGRDGSGSSGLPPRRMLALFMLFALALAFRLLYILEISDQVFFQNLLIDQQAYDNWARRIAAGDWLGDKPFYQSPFYPYFLALIYMTIGRSFVSVYIIQALLSAACVFAVYGIGRRSFGDARVGVLAALLWALYKVDFFFVGQVLKTSPGMSLLILALWLFFVFRDRPSAGKGIAAGLAAGLVMVFRGNFLAVMPLLVLWIAVAEMRRSGRRAAIPLLALFLSVVVFPAIVAVRNYAVSGELVLTTAQGGVNFYVGNYRENTLGVGKDPEWARRIPRFEQEDFREKAEELSGRKLSDSELSKFWFRQGMAEIAADPFSYLERLRSKALLIINWQEIPDNLNYDFFRERYSWVLSLPLPAFWLAGSFGLAGLVLALLRRRGGLLALYFFSYAATVLAFYVVNRYRFPLVPALLVFAAYGMVAAWDESSLKRWSTPVVFAVLVAAFAVTGSPRWAQSSPAQHWTKVGNAYAEENRYADAIQAYEKALQYDQWYERALVGLAIAYEHKYRYSEAIEIYSHLVRIDPKNARHHYLLARTLEKRGDISKAREHYRKATELDPDMKPARAALERLEEEGLKPDSPSSE